MGPHVTESLSAYMDGELAAHEREAVAVHLRGCPSCARHLEELRAVDAAARELPLSVPDGYFEAFRGSLRGRLQASRPARRLAPAWALATAAAVVLAVLTPRLLRDTHAPVAAPPAAPVPTLAAPPPASASQRNPIAEALPAMPRAEPPPRQPARPEGGARLAPGRIGEQPAPTAPPSAPPAAPAAEPAAKPAAPPTAGTDAAARERKEADGLRALGYADAPAQEPFVPAPQAAKTEAETGADGHAEEAKARRDKAAAVGALADRAAPAGEGRFELLARRTVASAAEARGLRDAWRAFARDEPAGPRADEARVRAIEAGAEAWRRGRDERDRAETRKDGRAYLERSDALQADRVREALRSLER